MKIVRFFILILFLTASCSGGDKESVDEIRSVAIGIIDADNHSDIDRVMSFYHTDAVLFPPEGSPIVGTDAIRKNYENIFSASAFSLEITIDEARAAGGWAIITGANKGKIKMLADQSEKTIDDRFVMFLEKENDEWKIRKLWWNRESASKTP